VSIVTTANSIRYGSANTDVWGTGVAGLDVAGVEGRRRSIGERMGEGAVRDPGRMGAGAAMGAGVGWGGLLGIAVGASCEDEAAGPAISMSIEPPPLSNTPDLVGAHSPLSTPPAPRPAPTTPCRSSYNTGENLTATLAFLCPGSCPMGGLAKFARE
jgi:hypothetical protein